LQAIRNQCHASKIGVCGPAKLTPKKTVIPVPTPDKFSADSMSRFKKYASSLFSGYILMGVNIAFTFLSVPLALHYLSKSEFGLWALVSQMAGYVALLDLGMSASVARTLIEYKDESGGANYGSVILTGTLVNLVQGFLIFVIGCILAFFLQDLLNIEPVLRHDFLLLTIGQCALMGAGFTTRIFLNMLIAHQRYDIASNSGSAAFLANIAVMWFCFAKGVGVYSILWGLIALQLVQTAAYAWGCFHLHLFPKRHQWGRPTWQRFRELFSLGRDFFLFILGSQMVNASQTILITRVLGLEACAVWSVCIRPLTMLQQLLLRIFEISYAGLSEMLVQQNLILLLRRFKSLVVVSSSMAAVSGVMLALCNQPFIEAWTKGKISWPLVNDALLAVWLVMIVLVRVHTGLITITKDFRAMRYLYFVEGIVFIGGSLLVLRHGGITSMLLVSIGASAACTLQYGVRRTAQFFGLSLMEVGWHWLLPAARCTLAMLPLAAVLWFATLSLGPMMTFGIRAVAGSLMGVGILWFWGSEPELKAEVMRRIGGKFGKPKTAAP
jgi:O-antigen/teichoic acid export membrane protein